MPFARYEYENIPARNVIATTNRLPTGMGNGVAGGFLLDISRYAAFKVQLDRVHYGRLAPQIDAIAQLAFAF